jgi:hypothetical protein
MTPAMLAAQPIASAITVTVLLTRDSREGSQDLPAFFPDLCFLSDRQIYFMNN